jgi:7-dehydrocholesterol reductase
MQVHGFLLALFAYLKAKYYSSHPEDNKISNSVLYDFFLGVELNPRIGDFDFKLFYNGRIGIILWTLVNLSCAARQYQLYGALTNSMVLLNIGQAVYVADFFFHEDWYLRTIDICHDHFGYYLAWGDTAWLPIMYALQAPFLVRHPRVLSTVECFLISLLFSLGYLIFRSANNQKDKFRATEGKAFFFNQKPTFINANYVTADGKQRESKLLTSGWWGLARHFNYTADLMMSLSFCLVCGFDYVLPYFYFLQLTILLVSRVFRDEAKCLSKYGVYWRKYCAKVKWRLIPKIF